jgi:DNA-binding beta-propeller fold protein YncE
MRVISSAMKKWFAGFVVLLLTVPALAQRPSDPALMLPQQAPDLDMSPVLDPLPVPAGMTMGAPAAVAFDARGHLFVLSRGAQAFWEYDEKGAFVRTFGDRFTRAHGLRIDRDGNLWATDVGAHTVMKFTRDGQLLLTIGTKGQGGDWNEATAAHLLNQPNDMAIAANGDIFVAQGHTPGPNGNARVLKFDKTGKFLTQWGGHGKGPGQFEVAHSIAVDAQGSLWVADRENQRIQVFDTGGKFLREMKYAGLPCAFEIARDYVWMVNGFAAQVLKLDLRGNVLAATGKQGKGAGEFGEAHFIAVSPQGELYVADSVNANLQKYVARK